MAQAPNTTTQKGFLRSVGDGSNQSFWSLPIATWNAEVDGATLPNTSGSTALSPALSVTVQGYSRYLVIYNASLANADTGGAHDGYIRIALDGTLVGPYSRTSLDKYSGGSYYYQAVSTSYVITTDTGSHTIAGYGTIIGASTTGLADRATLTIIGLP